MDEETIGGLKGSESMAVFGRIVPRNPVDWEGCVVVYSALGHDFFNISFGSGDNLGGEAIEFGFDDYIMVDRYALDGRDSLANVIEHVRLEGCVDDEASGLRMEDGGQWLLCRGDWEDGDIRRFIMDAMEFAGYRETRCMTYSDVLYICADYDKML